VMVLTQEDSNPRPYNFGQPARVKS
jgi:hypothetical protein